MLAALVSWCKRRILRDQRERWNHQYASGRWTKLHSEIERARFDACATLLRQHARGGRILELGCGEGILESRLAPGEYTRWLGVDLSEVAIARAQPRANEHVRYLAADMCAFTPQETFDAIVFSESIYYVPQPGNVLRRYACFLNPGGVLIVSIFTTKRSDAVWEQIHAVASPIDSRVTTNELGTWVCEVLRLR
jgi:2-polyprenyl-3-methyl-5-hydroxy-6-metoxy-1,4-benzoquinol methylase